MSLTCGARSTVNIDWSMVNSDWVSNGLWRARVGPVQTGLARTRGMLWRCHVVAMGLHWASSTVRPALCGSWWIGVHGPWTTDTVCGGPCPRYCLLRLVHGGPSAGLRCPSHPLSSAFPWRLTRWRRAPGEPHQRRWCAIDVGESFAKPQRPCWWG